MLTKHVPNPLPAYFRSAVSFFFGLLFRSNSSAVADVEGVRRILLINLGHIGDGILSLGAARTLRRHFPNAQISVLYGPWGEQIAERSGLFDGVVTYAGGAWRRRYRAMARRETVFGLRRRLGAGRFDVVVSLHSDMRTLFCEMLCRPRYRVDLGAMRIARKLGLSPRTGPDRHVCSDFNDLLRHLGIEEGFEAPRLKLTAEDFDTLPEDAKAAFGPGRRVVVIHPFGAYSEKEWSVRNYAELVNGLLRMGDVTVILDGVPKDEARAADLKAACDPGFVDTFGSTTFLGLGALIEKADLVITGDGGPMHLAAAVGTPVVALFGPTDPARWGPVTDRAAVLYHETDCGACNSTPHCIREPRCIDRITVAEVLAASRRLLDAGKG